MALSPKRQRVAFNLLRREGIKRCNFAQIGMREPDLHCERQLRGGSSAKAKDLLVCGNCSGFFHRKFFYKHKRNCQSKKDSLLSEATVPAIVLLTPTSVSEDFTNDVVSKFLQDKVGQFCSTDPTLLAFGQQLYYKLKAKQDKKTEVKRSVMCEMRRIGSLFFHFQDQLKQTTPSSETIELKDMLSRTHFQALATAVQKATTSDDSSRMKAGLKISLYYLLLKLAKFVRIKHLINENDTSAAEVEKFEQVLKLNYTFLFGDAIYTVNKNRETKLRRPEQLPPDDDLNLIRKYTLTRYDALLNDPYLHWTTTEYVELRNLADSRLTLFNARRGGEPARLTITNWRDAEQGVWLNSSRVLNMSPDEQALFRDMKIMFQTGKGNHFVPFLVPKDTVAALQKLCDPLTRLDCSVLASNHYLFPTVRSHEHVFGWHAVNVIAKSAGVVRPDLLTATGVRHYVSTKYAALDVPENQRTTFYKHMGHSANINATIYQAPLAEQEITHVGRVLQMIDRDQHTEQ